jgi:methyltransferase (TIGR00027 family)
MPDAAITPAPDHTAVRVALWRAMHLSDDASPHVFEDEVGLRLADPAAGWRDRPDMDPANTAGFRAHIVARARFIEELVAERAASAGVDQYVLLGAGLDTFVQRRPELASRLDVFEIDQPAPQAWKRNRLTELGYGVPDRLHLVPVDFETDADSWWDRLTESGFDPSRPAVVASTGVTMYLTKEANAATLRRLAAGLAPGSTAAVTFQVTIDLVDPADRIGREFSEKGARASGTPFLSFYRPEEMLEAARAAGFAEARHVSGPDLAARWFADRPDGLRPSTGEDFLVATV